MDLIPDQVQPAGTRTAESTNSAGDSTPLPGGLQRTPPGETLRSRHKREMQRLSNDPRSRAAESRLGERPAMTPEPQGGARAACGTLVFDTTLRATVMRRPCTHWRVVSSQRE